MFFACVPFYGILSSTMVPWHMNMLTIKHHCLYQRIMILWRWYYGNRLQWMFRSYIMVIPWYSLAFFVVKHKYGSHKVIFFFKCTKIISLWNSGHISDTSPFICHIMKHTWNSVLNKQRPGPGAPQDSFIYPSKHQSIAY